MKKDNNNFYGKLVSIADATLTEEPGGTDLVEERDPTEVGNLLTEYRLTRRINGIPVADEDTDLNIDSDRLLCAAFQLETEPKLLFTAIKPDDTESRKEYDALLAKLKAGCVRIIEEIKQYDQNSGSFVVWVRYEEIRFKLQPRYEYLRNE